MIKTLTKRQAANMRALYLRQEALIKAKLEKAIKKGNDPTYLQKILTSIRGDIKQLDQYFKTYSQKTLPGIYNYSGQKAEKAIRAFSAKNNVKYTFNRTNPYAVRVLAENTYNSLSKITEAIGRQTDDIIRDIGIKQTQGIVFGSDTWNQAAKQMTTDLRAKGYFSIKYKNGAKVPASAYSKMVARTTSAEAYRSGTRERIKDHGYDLVDILGVSQDPNSPCIPYEGKTLSLTGSTPGYTTIAEAQGQGLFHPSCVHDYGFSDENLKLIDENY